MADIWKKAFAKVGEENKPQPYSPSGRTLNWGVPDLVTLFAKYLLQEIRRLRTGFVLIFCSSCPTMECRPSRVFVVT
jgi:hypothetical protein